MLKVSPGCVFRTYRKVHRKSSKSGSTNKWKRNFPEPKREWPPQRPKLELTILRINLSFPHHKSSAAVSAIPWLSELEVPFFGLARARMRGNLEDHFLPMRRDGHDIQRLSYCQSAKNAALV